MDYSWQYARRRKHMEIPNPHRYRYELKGGILVPVGIINRELKGGDVVNVEGRLGLYTEYMRWGEVVQLIVFDEEDLVWGLFESIVLPTDKRIIGVHVEAPVFKELTLARLIDFDYLDAVIDCYKIYQRRVGINY